MQEFQSIIDRDGTFTKGSRCRRIPRTSSRIQWSGDSLWARSTQSPIERDKR